MPQSSTIKALVIGSGCDNVATAIAALSPGEALELDGIAIEVEEEIPAGHKLALHPIAAGAPVVKYRETIGTASVEIPAGHHVHVHNVVSARLPGPDRLGA